MSPEQVRGQPVDHRSDIFSLGVVLYEMLSGHRPFEGDSVAETLSAILRDQPADLELPQAPPEVTALVLGCLEKEPGARMPSAREIGRRLEAMAGAPSADPLGVETQGRRSVAVLPFRDLTGDPANAHLGLGLADATITELALVRSLLVRPTSAILPYQERTTSPQQAARELSVEAVVEASFQRSGSRLRVTVQLVAADGRPLWAAKIDTSLDDLFRMQDEVSRNIARALEVRLTPHDERRWERRERQARPAGDVYELYMRGKSCLFRETLPDFIAAVDWFEKARDADPAFAPALAGLADAYERIAYSFQPEGDWYARAQAMCDRALALDPRLPEGLYARARLRWSPRGGFDHAGAMRDLVAAIGGRPNLDEAYVRLGAILYHVGLIEEGVEEIDQALAIVPDHTLAKYHRGFDRYHQGRYEEALEISLSVQKRAPAAWIHYQTALCQLRLGRLEEAVATAHLMMQQEPDEVLAHPILGLAAAMQGEREEALAQVRLTAEGGRSYGHYHHAQYDAACIHALIGDHGSAVEWLAAAARNGYPCRPFFARDPLLDPLRGDERFLSLMDALAVECDSYARLFHELRSPAGSERA
jgi:eukaryotic-like serine/threonine-protein kinase